MYFVASFWQANMSQGCCKDVGGHIRYTCTVHGCYTAALWTLGTKKYGHVNLQKWAER